jgi:large subunit ribosomal protein L3
MTQIFIGERLIPVTAIEAGPCVVTQLKSGDRDGYWAVQIGFEDIKEKKVNRPLGGHFKQAKVGPKRHLAEIRLEPGEAASYEVGQEIRVDIFEPGERIDVVGTSKGKGFAGVVKRWGFKGFPASHGSRYHRAGGAIGMAASPARVIKGMEMPGRMGNSRITIQNLEVVKVIPEKNLILIKGAVPGAKGSLVMVKESVKVSKRGRVSGAGKSEAKPKADSAKSARPKEKVKPESEAETKPAENGKVENQGTEKAGGKEE